MVQLTLLSVVSLVIISAIGAPIPQRRGFKVVRDSVPVPRQDDGGGEPAPPKQPAPKPDGPPGSTPSDQGAASSSWNQTVKYQGKDFLDQWDYFDQKDPTNGMVNYQPKDQAQSKGLAKVGDDNVMVLSVDDTTTLKSGEFRDSVRISSKQKFNGGLFIADFQAMPFGCSVWPAWWSVGPNWPSGGEIDVLEGVHNQDANQYTLHTSEGCTLDTANLRTSAKVLGPTCASGPGSNAGCAFKDSDARTYGKGFNDAEGGVYAHQWDDSGIKIWHFARADVPEDIKNEKPDPSTWPQPAANFQSTTCSMKDHFHDHTLTIDTTLCGDWAGATYSQACPGTCADRVADPKNFKDAKWKINYIAVYSNN